MKAARLLRLHRHAGRAVETATGIQELHADPGIGRIESDRPGRCEEDGEGVEGTGIISVQPLAWSTRRVYPGRKENPPAVRTSMS